MTYRGGAAAFALLLLVCLAALAGDSPIPPLTGRVVDQTGTLSDGQKSALDAKLRDFELRKGSQIAVLVIATTLPEPIESFSIRVAEAWKIGRKQADDGVLIVVAKSDRTIRLEVGYGLEGAIPDAVAKRLIDEVFVPAFRAGSFYEGLDAGVDRLIRIVDGEALPEVGRRPSGGGEMRSLESYFMLFFIATLVLGGVLRGLLGRLPAAVVVGAGIGILAWLIVAPVLVALLVAAIAFVVTLLGGGGGMPGRMGGGFGGGGFGGGGGGGFRGGGGGFGGGGASGRW
ncbi:MAG: TPM domain-containing protein [Betaproteobacteria bacterium]